MARKLFCLVVAGLLGVLTTLVGARAAGAHGTLAVSTPAKDSTVSSPLEAVLLYFTEKPAPNAYFTVTAPGGLRVDQPWTHAEPKRLDEPIQEYQLVNGSWEPRVFNAGFPAKVPVAYWPTKGVYTAHYFTVASDGETVQGDVSFTYTGGVTNAPAGWQTPTNQPDPGLVAAADRGAPRQDATAGPTPAGDGVTPRAEPQQDPGTAVWVWLLPALLAIGVAWVILRAARRPAPEAAGRARATEHHGTKHQASKHEASKHEGTKHEATNRQATKQQGTKRQATKRQAPIIPRPRRRS